MDKKNLRKRTAADVKVTEVVSELSKLYEQALDVQDIQLAEILRLEIRRSILQKPLLIPAGEVDGLILDPTTVLLG